jgi:hypothetical protein
MKRKRHLFFKGIICAFILWGLFLCFRAAFFNVVHEKDVLDGMVELRASVMMSMEQGKETDVFYVKNIETNDINDINKYVDSAFGNVVAYRVLLSSGDYLAVEFTFDRSDNYYVVRKVLYGEDIPSDNQRAIDIYNVYCDFYSSCIHEPMSDFDKEVAAHDYLVKNCKYGYPENEDDAYDAYGTMVEGHAVCDGYAEAFFLMMTCLGIDSDIVVGTASGELHAWNQVKLDNEWYNVDVTWDDSLPDMGEYVKHTYFNIDDSALGVTHVWETEFYRECTSVTKNYYQAVFAYYQDYDSFKTGILNQAGRGQVWEAAIYGYTSNDIDLTFLYDTANVRRVRYLVEDMGTYKAVIIYINI